MPDFGAVVRSDCLIDTGGAPAAAAMLKFVTKQAMIASLVVVYGLLYLCGQPTRKRGAVHAMGAFYSLLFLGFAKDAFYMTATTGVEGPDYNGSSFQPNNDYYCSSIQFNDDFYNRGTGRHKGTV